MCISKQLQYSAMCKGTDALATVCGIWYRAARGVEAGAAESARVGMRRAASSTGLEKSLPEPWLASSGGGVDATSPRLNLLAKQSSNRCASWDATFRHGRSSTGVPFKDASVSCIPPRRHECRQTYTNTDRQDARRRIRMWSSELRPPRPSPQTCSSSRWCMQAGTARCCMPGEALELTCRPQIGWCFRRGLPWNTMTRLSDMQ